MTLSRPLPPHPAILLFGALCYLLLVFLVSGFYSLIYLIILFIIFGWRAGLEGGKVARDIARVWPLLTITFLFHTYLSGHPEYSWPEILSFWRNTEGFQNALFFTIRLILILSVSIALFQLHPPQHYGRELGRILVKLRLTRKLANQIEIIISLAFRMVPFLEQETHRLQLALTARGGDAGRGRMQRLATYRRILLPLILNAFRRADHVALALEARGFDPRCPRTSYHLSVVTVRQLIAAILAVAACSVAFLL